MNNSSFTISEKMGLSYAKKTGDYNKIHLDFYAGYNSIYGQKICHGCLVFQKTYKKIIKKKSFLSKKNIEISFYKHFNYHEKIFLKIKNNYIKLKQNNIIKAEIKLSNNHLDIDFKKIKFNKYKYFKLTKFITGEDYNLYSLLGIISYHVGMVYPGHNSILEKIEIFNFSKKIKIKNGIYSRLVKKGYPFIDNFLIYENFFFIFKSIIRPFLLQEKIVPSKFLINLVKKLKSNILILGASSGIGNDLLNLIKVNKKIKIIATYYKNKLTTTSSNIEIYKIDVLKNMNKILKIIKRKNVNTIYYFPTPKISLQASSVQIKLYNLIYLKIPKNLLLNMCNKQKINFFYPSTVFIDMKKNDFKYSQIKLKAERQLIKLSKRKNINLKISRLPQISSRQNLNILNIQYPKLLNLLESNLKFQKDFFLRSEHD